MTGDTMKKTIVAMLVSGTILFPGLSQAQTLEQSVAQSLATHPKIKEAFDLYQAQIGRASCRERV